MIRFLHFLALALCWCRTCARLERTRALQNMMESLKIQVDGGSEITPEVQENIQLMLDLIPEIMSDIKADFDVANATIKALADHTISGHDQATRLFYNTKEVDKSLWECYSSDLVGEEVVYQRWLTCRDEQWVKWDVKNITCDYPMTHNWELADEHYGEKSCQYNYNDVAIGIPFRDASIDVSSDSYLAGCSSLKSFDDAVNDIEGFLEIAQSVHNENALKCDNATRDWTNKKAECAGIFTEYLTKQIECNSLRSQKEMDMCELQQIVHPAFCENYATWHSFYSRTVKVVGDNVSEFDRENEWNAVRHIQCMLESYRPNLTASGPGFDVAYQTTCMAEETYPHKFVDYHDEVTNTNSWPISCDPPVSNWTLHEDQYYPVVHAETWVDVPWKQDHEELYASYSHVHDHTYTLDSVESWCA